MAARVGAVGVVRARRPALVALGQHVTGNLIPHALVEHVVHALTDVRHTSDMTSSEMSDEGMLCNQKNIPKQNLAPDILFMQEGISCREIEMRHGCGSCVHPPPQELQSHTSSRLTSTPALPSTKKTRIFIYSRREDGSSGKRKPGTSGTAHTRSLCGKSCHFLLCVVNRRREYT